MDTTTVVDPAESSSLADHEQAYHPSTRTPGERQPTAPAVTERHDDGIDPAEAEGTPAERDRDEKGQFRPKQRAKSQKAGADDVEQINAYTRRIREAEEKLGLKIEKQDGESERVYQLRRRAELAEARVTRAPETAPVAPRRESPKPIPFTDAKPRYEDFANEDDQYSAWMLATAKWERRKDESDSATKSHEDARNHAITERNRQRDEWFKAREGEHLDRMAAYHAEHPEAHAILDRAGDVHLTPAIYAAVMTAENSPELLILVAQNEELRDDLTILTEGKPLNRDLVALVQRRLNRGLAAGKTGSAPALRKPVPAVPRPPNPVRTGPMTPSETPPGDDSGLDDHERFYGKGRRR